MAKQKRLVTLTGHLLKPYYRYVSAAEIYLSPIDIKGNELGERLHHVFSHWRQELRQPGLIVKKEVDLKSMNSYMKIKYINNWCNTYAFKDFNQQILLDHMDAFAHIVDLDVKSTTEDDIDDYPMEYKQF